MSQPTLIDIDAIMGTDSMDEALMAEALAGCEDEDEEMPQAPTLEVQTLALCDGEASKADAGKASMTDAGEASKADGGEASKADAGKASKADAGEASKADAGVASKADAGEASKAHAGVASKADAGVASKADAGEASTRDSLQLQATPQRKTPVAPPGLASPMVASAGDVAGGRGRQTRTY